MLLAHTVVLEVCPQQSRASLEFRSRNELYHIQLVCVLAHVPLLSFVADSGNSTDLTLSQSTIGSSDNFNVTVTVHNTGSVAGKEVVQVN